MRIRGKLIGLAFLAVALVLAATSLVLTKTAGLQQLEAISAATYTFDGQRIVLR